MAESGFALELPFVTVQSKGGPHEDVAYVAGWMMGAIDTMLGLAQPSTFQQPVYTSCVPQIDLIAMRHGYTLQSTPYDDEWTTVRLVRAVDHVG